MQIDYFYYDLSICSRCKKTAQNLDNAIKELGLNVTVKKHQLKDHQEYVDGFGNVISPSIFVDGKDIFEEIKTSSCGECSQLCGESVSCRSESEDSGSFAKYNIKLALEKLT